MRRVKVRGGVQGGRGEAVVRERRERRGRRGRCMEGWSVDIDIDTVLYR